MGTLTKKSLNNPVETFAYKSKSEAGISRERKQVVVDTELDKILKKEGNVTTDRLLEVASKQNHPLHKYFEWDDSAAAV